VSSETRSIDKLAQRHGAITFGEVEDGHKWILSMLEEVARFIEEVAAVFPGT
jgi:hypothetical protein